MKKNRKVVKAGLGYVIGNYFLKGLQFFTIPIFSRLLSTSDYGIYNSFVAYETIFFVIVGFAIHTSFKNAKYRYEDKYEEYVSSSFFLLLISLVIWLLILLCFSTFFIQLLKLNKICLIMLLLFSFSSAVITCINSYLALNYRYKSFLIISGINAFGNITLSIFLIKYVFINEGYMGRIIGSTIPALLISFICIFLIFKNKKPVINKEYWRWGLHYSIPIIPHGISQVILNQFDRIMIHNMIGAAQAGIYSFSYNIYTILNVTTSSLGNVWEPWVFENLNNKNYTIIRKRSSQYILGILCFTICVMFLSPEIIKILGSESYWDAQYSVLPIIAAGFFSFLYTISSSIEYFYEKTKFIAVGSIFAATLNVVLNFLFIQKCGYIAAAYTTLITYFLYFLVHYFISRKILSQKIMEEKVIILSISLLLITMIATEYFRSNFLLRIMVVMLIIVIAFLYEEKYFGYMKNKTIKRRDKK